MESAARILTGAGLPEAFWKVMEDFGVPHRRQLTALHINMESPTAPVMVSCTFYLVPPPEAEAQVEEAPPPAPAAAAPSEVPLVVCAHPALEAINFAIELDAYSAQHFLSDWREGNLSDWPEFKFAPQQIVDDAKLREILRAALIHRGEAAEAARLDGCTEIGDPSSYTLAGLDAMRKVLEDAG